jgi:hypothetical protein
MYSRRFTIENGDLTSGEIQEFLPIIKTITASNNEREEILFPSSMTCWNNGGVSINLVFLTSGELAEYITNPERFEGIVVGADTGAGPDTLYVNDMVPKSEFVKIIPEAALTGKVELSFFTYNRKY